MKYTKENNHYVFVRENGETIKLTMAETSFLAHEFEKVCWEYRIEDAIEDNIDHLNFSEMSREEFVAECVKVLDERWKDGYDLEWIDYDDLVADTASDCEIYEMDY